MLCGRSSVTVVRQDAAQIHRESFVDGAARGFGIDVENPRRTMRERPITRKEIPTEEQTERLAVVSGVTGRMAGQTHRLQSVPEIEKIVPIVWGKPTLCFESFSESGH